MSLPRQKTLTQESPNFRLSAFLPLLHGNLPIIRALINPDAIISHGVETRQGRRKANNFLFLLVFHVNVDKDFVTVPEISENPFLLRLQASGNTVCQTERFKIPPTAFRFLFSQTGL